MKRSLIALCLLFALSLAAFGGEVETPGKQDPTPTPTPVTSTATTTDTSGLDSVTLDLITIIAGLVWP